VDSFVSSVPLLVACTILPAPHAVYALQFVVHRHGSDRAAIEADSFEHAAIKTRELGLYPAQVTREESRKSFLHYVEKTSPARTQPGPWQLRRCSVSQ